MRHSTRARAAAATAARIERQPFAAGDPDLPAHEIDPGHHLGDRMLHLEAGVHLEKVERPVLVEQELDRAGVGVSDRAGDRRRRRRDRVAQLWRDCERWRFLDHLLMPALNRTLAFDKRKHRPVVIAKQLHLDVARPQDASLEVDGCVAKGGAGFRARRAHRVRQVGGARHRPHALAAATSHGLDQQRVPNGRGGSRNLRIRHVDAQRLGCAGHDRHARTHGRIRAPRSCCPSAPLPQARGR